MCPLAAESPGPLSLSTTRNVVELTPAHSRALPGRSLASLNTALPVALLRLSTAREHYAMPGAALARHATPAPPPRCSSRKESSCLHEDDTQSCQEAAVR
eukprot:3941059-Rhodomonas_salina.1